MEGRLRCGSLSKVERSPGSPNAFRDFVISAGSILFDVKETDISLVTWVIYLRDPHLATQVPTDSSVRAGSSFLEQASGCISSVCERHRFEALLGEVQKCFGTK